MNRALFVSLALAGTAALAGSALSEDQDGRYRLEKSETGYVRMDTRTGDMSICEERSGQLICRLAADERSAFQDEIDRLQSQVETLDGRVAKLENSLAAKLENSLPTEEQFEKTMSYMERFLRGFIGIVKDMDKPDTGGDAEPALPQKT